MLQACRLVRWFGLGVRRTQATTCGAGSRSEPLPLRHDMLRLQLLLLRRLLCLLRLLCMARVLLQQAQRRVVQKLS